MAVPPTFASNLDLTMSPPSSVKDLDINQVPFGGSEDEWVVSTVEGEETNNGVVPGKKLRLSKEQSGLLEESFRQNHTLNHKQKEALALQLKLRPRQVEVWFQNRRARSKLKQTEMECEYLKTWFGSLTEQNRRLRIQVDQLKAMKVGPRTVILPLASTLTMCSRCERVTGDSIKSTDSTTGTATKVGKASALR